MAQDERIAKLETKVENLETQFAEALKELKMLNENMIRQKGFIGGLLFVGSALGLFFSSYLSDIVKTLLRKIGVSL